MCIQSRHYKVDAVVRDSRRTPLARHMVATRLLIQSVMVSYITLEAYFSERGIDLSRALDTS
jgi:hypothetical protein